MNPQEIIKAASTPHSEFILRNNSIIEIKLKKESILPLKSQKKLTNK